MPRMMNQNEPSTSASWHLEDDRSLDIRDSTADSPVLRMMNPNEPSTSTSASWRLEDDRGFNIRDSDEDCDPVSYRYMWPVGLFVKHTLQLFITSLG